MQLVGRWRAEIIYYLNSETLKHLAVIMGTVGRMVDIWDPWFNVFQLTLEKEGKEGHFRKDTLNLWRLGITDA